jgi:hypothetical protein
LRINLQAWALSVGPRYNGILDFLFSQLYKKKNEKKWMWVLPKNGMLTLAGILVSEMP